MPTTKKYYKIGPRNAWDTVSIGPFASKDEAIKHLPIGCSENIIKELSAKKVEHYVK